MAMVALAVNVASNFRRCRTAVQFGFGRYVHVRQPPQAIRAFEDFTRKPRRFSIAPERECWHKLRHVAVYDIKVLIVPAYNHFTGRKRFSHQISHRLILR
jgi:hypothetical protein